MGEWSLKRLMIGLLASALATSLFLTGCAYTTMDCRLAPGYEDAHYDKVLVWVDVADGRLRLDAERRFVREFAEKGAIAVAHEALFFPEKEYSSEEFYSVLRDNDVDATLYVFCTGSASQSFYMPGSAHTKGRVNPNTGAYSSTTSFLGGQTIETPIGYYTARLYDAGTGEISWVGYAETEGDVGADTRTLLRSLADKASGELVKEQIVRGRPSP